MYYNLGHFNKDKGVILQLLQVIISSSKASVGRLLLHTIQQAVSLMSTPMYWPVRMFSFSSGLSILLLSMSSTSWITLNWFLRIHKFNIIKGAYCKMFQEVAFVCCLLCWLCFPKGQVSWTVFHRLLCCQLCIWSWHFIYWPASFHFLWLFLLLSLLFGKHFYSRHPQQKEGCWHINHHREVPA